MNEIIFVFRVVVSILDSFHFDLRSLKEEDINGSSILFFHFENFYFLT